MKKRFLSGLLAGLTALTLMALPVSADELLPAPELPAAENGEMAILTRENDPEIGPLIDNYTFPEGEKTADSYTDPSIAVRVGWGRYEKTNYVYARVKIATPEQIRTCIVNSYHSESTVVAASVAAKRNAVIAVNGDYCGSQNKNAAVIRQGETFKLNLDLDEQQKEKGTKVPDILLIDDKGDLHILKDATNADVEARLDTVVNAFTFGPGLIIDGEPQYGYLDRQMSTHKAAQRMAICQTGPLEYLLITTEGPEDPGSVGLTMDKFVALLDSFGEVQNAYNLDGGSSATLVFRKGNKLQNKINAPRNSKTRPVRDIIYFAGAWIPDPPPTDTPEPTETPAPAEAGETVSPVPDA